MRWKYLLYPAELNQLKVKNLIYTLTSDDTIRADWNSLECYLFNFYWILNIHFIFWNFINLWYNFEIKISDQSCYFILPQYYLLSSNIFRYRLIILFNLLIISLRHINFLYIKILFKIYNIVIEICKIFNNILTIIISNVNFIF